METGSFIRQSRAALGVSLRSLAQQLDMDPAYLSRIESGRTPPSEQMLRKLAAVLGRSEDELLLLSGRLPERLRELVSRQPHRAATALRTMAEMCVAEPGAPYGDPLLARRGRRAIEDGFPFEQISEVAEVESWRKEVYRPVYHMHKWWAQRLGSVFRAAIIAAAAPRGSSVTDLFYEPLRLPGVRGLRPVHGQRRHGGRSAEARLHGHRPGHQSGCVSSGPGRSRPDRPSRGPLPFQTHRGKRGPRDPTPVPVRRRGRKAVPGPLLLLGEGPAMPPLRRPRRPLPQLRLRVPCRQGPPPGGDGGLSGLRRRVVVPLRREGRRLSMRREVRSAGRVRAAHDGRMPSLHTRVSDSENGRGRRRASRPPHVRQARPSRRRRQGVSAGDRRGPARLRGGARALRGNGAGDSRRADRRRIQHKADPQLRIPFSGTSCSTTASFSPSRSSRPRSGISPKAAPATRCRCCSPARSNSTTCSLPTREKGRAPCAICSPTTS